MTTEPQEGRLDDGLTVLRRVGDYEVLEEDGNLRPSSQVVILGSPDGNVSVYLASDVISNSKMSQNLQVGIEPPR